MPSRTFLDAAGRSWVVWAVYPTPTASSTTPASGVAATYRDGWLAFESGDAKRRLAPVPRGWETLNDLALATLCEAAEPARIRTRDQHRSEGRP